VTNNDILRRIRYILDLSDSQVTTIFSHVEHPVTREQLSNWLKKEEDADYKNCNDNQLAHFLNGLIIEQRGKKDGALPKAEKKLNNNLIFTKLKIAFNLKAEDVLAVLALADLRISKHELSAFFRKTDHKHYRSCKDQILRNFLMGLQLKLRPSDSADEAFAWPDQQD
ncbi:UNVERIFIED_CONTAM: hypothetical protein GTU68_061682, partial [Idotea baltica]|nr:hypothetical protein [Idotea baltica]